ncbi:MAG: lysis system i-spanin subunit Rz [Pseudomonas qingdaonensis]|uniref:lysis system i-spanin subunit Rz n=1 Tax=Pseudomonas qingdaonensis TaxID=2056231 RepID=UPI001E465AD9
MNITPLHLVPFALLFGLLSLGPLVLLNDRLESARRERDTAQYERDGLREAARITGERLAQAAANDLKHTQELADARQKNLDLRRAVDAGDQRLFVKATCPAAVPADAGAGSVADASPPELAADARSDYFTLRDQLALSRRMILGLQDHQRLCQR